MEFDIFIITQIVYIIVTFKSIISTFSRAHIATLAQLQVLNAWVYDRVLFVSKLINIKKWNYHDNTAYMVWRSMLPRC